MTCFVSFAGAVSPVLVAAFVTLAAGCTHAAPPTMLPAPAVVAAQDALPATDAKPIPKGGTAMIPGDATAALSFNSTPDKGSGETVPVTGQSFKTAKRFETKVKSATNYAIQATTDSPGMAKKGDVLFVSFYARAVQGQRETGEARTQFVWEKQGEPWTKYSEVDISVGKEWKRIFIPLTMRDDAPPQTHIALRLGYGEQIIEVADLTFVNYGDTVKIGDLPRTRVTYRGMEAGAAWRKEAEARIEKIRKGNVTVVVKNAAGKTVPNANVSLAMTKHAFGFGTAVSDAMISDKTANGDKYRAWVKEYATKCVIENDLKWTNFEQNPERAKHVVKWLNDNDIEAKGHNLVWPSYRNSPKDIEAIGTDKAKLAKRINDHIMQEATMFKGQLVEWDVINEPWDNHDFMDILGKDSMVHWFKLTKSLDPKPRLTLNDYPKVGDSSDTGHLDHFYDTIDYLQKQKAPLEAIGFQGHYGSSLTPPEDVLKGFARFDVFGLPITVTEFDINTTDEALKAVYMRDFTTAAFSHPSVDTIIMWGFWEGAHWLPDAALFSRDWTIRPHGTVYQDLLHKKWWTNANGKTGTKGTYQTRGFYGDYNVTVTLPGGAKKTVPAKITKGAKNEIVVTI